MAEFRVVIPARYASSRFPGKPLARLAGRPMIEHVHRCAVASGAAEVIVATDDGRIADAVRGFGGTVALTRADHVSGTDRIAEVSAARGWPADTIVVNVQGDAPLTPAASVLQVAALLAAHPRASMATLCVPVATPEDYASPHVVKVVMDQAGRALYFSRASIPSAGHGSTGLPGAWRHLGIYAYRCGELQRLSAGQPCYLETVEKLEQLRALWMGMEIRIAPAQEGHGPDVDTPSDLAAVEAGLAGRRG
ncbi:3-deoxy-manno-octulosonate cytidylyltransferase (CMP-KDO synthetase) [Gammaproteobacteria bacterium]|nr:3-deoxy-manno-octulosonate cytidylyltransferase [Gammaproteobacteria bacterium]CAG0943000.1 3-deoxy-manno-octulosonate cytidylyltransferase (CMP-KDO synthetase) [Gammaproteobacteria bacterium]